MIAIIGTLVAMAGLCWVSEPEDPQHVLMTVAYALAWPLLIVMLAVMFVRILKEEYWDT